MSRPWRLTTAIGLFLVAVVGIIFAVIALTNEPPTVDYAAGHQSGQPVDLTMQTVGSFGSGNHPTWVSYLTQNARRGSGSTPRCGRSRPTPGSTSRSTSTTRGARCATSRSARSPGPSANVALLNGKPIRLINSNVGNGVGHTFSIPTLGINVPLFGINPNANLCAAAPCTTKSPDKVIRFSFITPGPGTVPVAVLRAVRPGLPLRQRRPDADHRLHGRLHEGGGVSDPEPGHRRRRCGTRRPSDDRAESLVAPDRHLGRALGHPRPALLYLRRAARPPGTMTSTAGGAQFDFNVLFVIALPVMLGVWIYMVYAIVMWRASRGGPEPVGGPGSPGPSARSRSGGS